MCSVEIRFLNTQNSVVRIKEGLIKFEEHRYHPCFISINCALSNMSNRLNQNRLIDYNFQFEMNKNSLSLYF